MKSKLLTIFLSLGAFAFAEEIDMQTLNTSNNKINYYNIEGTYNSPTIGLGSRNFFNHHGYDYNISTDPVSIAKDKLELFPVRANLNYLYSFLKNPNGSPYIGIGINSYSLVSKNRVNEYASPCLVLGTHFPIFNHKSFVELKGNWTKNSFSYHDSKYSFDEKNDQIQVVSARLGFGF
ncbi:MAG: hypothetical protein WCT85_07505 [Parachlamydiales bacterium]|jgi:hypothetical protein